MPMPASEIETLIKAAFPDADVVIEDLRGEMVYKALGGRMGGELHALALQTSAPTSN